MLGLGALGVLLYLALTDAAVETFVGHSPLRWIIGGTVAAYLALSALLWRKLSWAAKASLSLFVLFSLMAFAAWRPEGSDSPLTLLRQPTSTLLSAATILGILLAGWILARLKFLPWPARGALVLLAAYGVAAFVVGIMARTPYGALLHGGSLWEKLPFWLQGAFIGAMVVVPASLLVDITERIHRRWGRMHSANSGPQQTVALAMSLTLSLSGLSAPAGQGTGHSLQNITASLNALTVQEKEEAYNEEVSALQDRLTRLQSYLDGFPKELTEVAALAATVPTPKAAFEYVRDQVALEPYPGVMKGAGATLTTRGGNSLDRALLLAAILEQNNVPARIAHGKLSPDQTQNLLQQIATEPGSVERILQSLANHAPPPNLTDHQQELGKLHERRAEKAGSALRDAVDKNLPLLESALKQASLPGEAVAVERRLEIVQDHYWVQATVDGQNVDLDPSLKSNGLNQKLTDAVETLDPENLDGSFFQHVRFRLVAQFLDNGRLRGQELLSKDVKATDLLGKNLRLAIAPCSPKEGETRFQALLIIGSDRTEGQEFRLGGESAGGADSSSSGTGDTDTGAAKTAGGIGGEFGGGGEEEPSAPKPKAKPDRAASGPVLVRLFLEVTSSGPHLADAQYQRVILDRLDASGSQIQPDLADDKVVRALLIQAWDGAASVGSNHPVRVLATRLDALKAKESMEEKARARLYLGADFGGNDLPGPVHPPELTDYFFASDMARFLLVRQLAPKARWYYERPRLALFRHGFVVGDWSRPQGAHRFAEGIDLLNTPIQFLGDAGAAKRLGLESGIADTALERLTVSPNQSFNTIPLFAAASAASIPILAISPDRKSALENLTIPWAIKNVLAGELVQGQTLILPARLVQIGDTRTYGWWSIDPASGMALGKMELGGAQAMTETIEMHEKIEKWTEIFAKFYGKLLQCYMKALGENLGGLEALESGHLKHGAPGENPMPDSDELATCAIEAACGAVADLLAEATTSAAFAKEATEEVKSLYDIILEWAAETRFKKNMEHGAEEVCKQAAGVEGGAED
jgi:hypothetical protein